MFYQPSPPALPGPRRVATSAGAPRRTVVVAADELRRRACQICLGENGVEPTLVLDAASGGRVLELCREVTVDVLLLSTRLPDSGVGELLAELARLRPADPLPVVLLADGHDDPRLPAALDRLAVDVVPWHDLDRFVLRRAVDLAVERGELHRRLHTLERELADARRREAELQRDLTLRRRPLGVVRPLRDRLSGFAGLARLALGGAAHAGTAQAGTAPAARALLAAG